MTRPNPAAPTHVRYLIVFVAMLAAVLLYLERVCVSVAEVFIREDLRIGTMQMDAAFGAFFVAYALAQVPSGWLSQRYGPRLMMALYMLGWSTFGVFIALAQDFWTLFLARFLLGLSQAGAYPTAAVLVKRWVPDRSRGIASSIVAFGGRFGAAGANWLTGVLIVAFVPISADATVQPGDMLEPSLFATLLDNPDPAHLAPVRTEVRRQLESPAMAGDPSRSVAALNSVIRNPTALAAIDPTLIGLARDGQRIRQIPPADRTADESGRLNRLTLEKAFPGAFRQLHAQGWRPTLLLYGVSGVVVGALFWLLTRDWPRTHPWCNAAEVELIESGQARADRQARPGAIPWRLLVRSRNQWLISVSSIFLNIGWIFLITLLPRFLSERFAVPVDQRGLMTTIPLFTSALGLLAGGWATDWLTQRYGRRWGRAIPLGVFKLPAVIGMLICPSLPSPWAVTIALSIMAVAIDFGIPAFWAFAQDTSGPQVGAVLGWTNMWGNLGAGLAPPLLGLIAKTGGWDATLYFSAAALLISGVTGMLVNAEEPLFSDETTAP